MKEVCRHFGWMDNGYRRDVTSNDLKFQVRHILRVTTQQKQWQRPSFEFAANNNKAKKKATTEKNKRQPNIFIRTQPPTPQVTTSTTLRTKPQRTTHPSHINHPTVKHTTYKRLTASKANQSIVVASADNRQDTQSITHSETQSTTQLITQTVSQLVSYYKPHHNHY